MEKQFNTFLDALNNETRIKMLKIICENSMHISQIARELNVSVPVVSKHAAILEDANLISRKVFGKSHVLSVKDKNVLSNTVYYNDMVYNEREKYSNIRISEDYSKVYSTIQRLMSA
ncbi:winged helix-turn-helix domain-containing protein [Methanolobus vulcani]|nr:winged helix-turn-helix domain-containing protein [Methanolobus vulcani]